MADQVVLQFSTTPDLASKFIRMMCHSPFSHVDIMLENGLLGASDCPMCPHILGNPRGIALRPFDYYHFQIRRRAVIKTDKADAILAAAMSQIGKPFDTGAVKLRTFLNDKPFSRDWRDTGKWFCSEWAAWSFEQGGYWCHELIWPKNRLTPSDFLCMFITDPNFVNWNEFWSPIAGLKLHPKEI